MDKLTCINLLLLSVLALLHSIQIIRLRKRIDQQDECIVRIQKIIIADHSEELKKIMKED